MNADSRNAEQITIAPCACITSFVVGVFLGLAPLLYDRGVADSYQLPKLRAFVFAAWLLPCLLMFGTWLRGRRLRIPIEVLALIGFVGVAVVSGMRSVAPTNSVAALCQFVAPLGFYGLAVLLAFRVGHVRWLFAGLAAQGLCVALVALGQRQGFHLWEDVGEFLTGSRPDIPVRWGAWEAARSSLSGLIPVLADNVFDFPARPGARLFEMLTSVDPPGSVGGHVNVAAEMTLVGLLGTIGVLATLAGSRTLVSWMVRVLCVPVVAIQVGFLYMSGSRAVWAACVGLILLVGLVLLVRAARAGAFRRWALPSALGLGGLVLALVLLDQHVTVPNRAGRPDVHPSERIRALLDFSSGSEQERLALWANTWVMAREHPVLGIGPGNWKVVYPRYSHARLEHAHGRLTLRRQPERAHMEPLHLLAETGYLGLALMALFVVLACWRLLEAGPARGVRWVALMLVLGLLAIGLVAFPFQLPVTACAWFLCLGMGQLGSGRRSFHLAPGTLGLAGILWLALGGAAFFHVAQRMAGERIAWLAGHDRQAASFAGADNEAVGLSAIELKQRSRARFDQALARMPSDYRYGMERARLVWDMGLGDESLRGFRRVQAAHPNLVQAFLLEAELRMVRGNEEDLKRSRRLLSRAASILPNSPDVRHALARQLVQRPVKDAAERNRNLTEASLQLQHAVEGREYMPEARMLLAQVLMDLGAPSHEVLKHLEVAQVNASKDSKLMCLVARLYSDSRLGMAAPGIFGPGGRKPLDTFNRALKIAAGSLPEAEVELGMAQIERDLQAGRPLPPVGILTTMLDLVDRWRASEPSYVPARRFRALLLEHLKRDQEARMEWAQIVRWIQREGRGSPRFHRMMNEAAEASSRLRESPR